MLKSRLVVGLMSGTSLDGVDAALARLDGSGREQKIAMLHFISVPYPDDLRRLLLKNSQPASSSVLEISQLNVRLAHTYADAVNLVLSHAGKSIEELDAVGCHGQTIYHVPDPELCAGLPTRSTLQIGDPSTLANLLSTTVVGDFRLADMAAGGQGAPLVPFFDHVYFSDAKEHRILLNIGGIANLSLLPANAASDSIIAFDTGPGNMVIDAVVQRFFDRSFDEDGQIAFQGAVNDALLQRLLAEDYYKKAPPKSTGREYYNQEYVNALISSSEALGVDRPQDLVATVSALTIEAIAQSYFEFIEPQMPAHRIIVSGGGVHNRYLMEGLKSRFGPVHVDSMETFGLDPDAKEALCFAVLAHETLNGVASNVPSATGASKPAILGKICLPA